MIPLSCPQVRRRPEPISILGRARPRRRLLRSVAAGHLVASLLATFAGGCGGVDDPPVTRGAPTVLDRLPWHDDGVWLAGDTHTHNLYKGNGRKIVKAAAESGIDFMATTEHAHRAFGRKVESGTRRFREDYPDLLLIAGVEWNVPAGDHATVLIETCPEEWDVLGDFTFLFDRKANEGLKSERPDDDDPETWGTLDEARCGLEWLRDLTADGGPRSVVYLNHLARHDHLTAGEIAELREAGLSGVEGAPGHQRALDRQPTIDRFDPFVAEIGGGYDRLARDGALGLSAGSDFHHSGTAYLPGVFSRTLVYAPERSSGGVVEGLTRGATVCVLGGVVSAAQTMTSGEGGTESALIGEVLRVECGTPVSYAIEVDIPKHDWMEDTNRLNEMEVISDYDGAAAVVRRFKVSWRGEVRLEFALPACATSEPKRFFLRARGRRRRGGEGNDVHNADFMFYTAATRVHVIASSESSDPLRSAR